MKNMENYNESIYPPTLSSERLVLRRLEESDVEAMKELLSDQEVNTFLPWFCVTTIAETKAFMKERFFDTYENQCGYHYVICLKDNSKVIGYIQVSGNEAHDFGYGLAKAYWHQGITSEAAICLLQYLKTTDLPFVTATHDVNNPNSGGVMKKMGMQYCYSYEEQCQPKNEIVIFRLYQLNLDGANRMYTKYQKMYPHWIETLED